MSDSDRLPIRRELDRAFGPGCSNRSEPLVGSHLRVHDGSVLGSHQRIRSRFAELSRQALSRG